MVWTGAQFAERHNHGLHGGKATHAAHIANAMLRSGVPEGESIATANKWAQRHANGGGTYDYNRPQISREDDAEVLSGGRIQSPQTDINLSQPPAIHEKYGPIEMQPRPSWLPGPIPNDVIPTPHHRQHAAHGGIVGRDDGGGIGGIAPSVQSMNPLVQNSIQQFSQLPTEKLAELAARLGPTQQGQLAQRILQQKRMMPPPVQAQQQQPQQQSAPSPQGYRRGGAPAARATGGDMGLSPSQGSPWWTRSEARGADSGFLHGTTPGRADSVQTTAPGGAYVLPAEVIAGLGEGNSLAGARVADAIFSTGPHGIPLPRGGRGMGPPRAPAPFREQQAARGGPIKLFKGGVADDQEVLLSHGEYVISPQFCEALGTRKKDGKVIPEPAADRRKRAHRWLDKWTVDQNKRHIVALKKYPGPVKT